MYIVLLLEAKRASISVENCSGKEKKPSRCFLQEIRLNLEEGKEAILIIFQDLKRWGRWRHPQSSSASQATYIPGLDLLTNHPGAVGNASGVHPALSPFNSNKATSSKPCFPLSENLQYKGIPCWSVMTNSPFLFRTLFFFLSLWFFSFFNIWRQYLQPRQCWVRCSDYGWFYHSRIT